MVGKISTKFELSIGFIYDVSINATWLGLSQIRWVWQTHHKMILDADLNLYIDTRPKNISNLSPKTLSLLLFNFLVISVQIFSHQNWNVKWFISCEKNSLWLDFSIANTRLVTADKLLCLLLNLLGCKIMQSPYLQVLLQSGICRGCLCPTVTFATQPRMALR